jgi:hypothetical protein
VYGGTPAIYIPQIYSYLGIAHTTLYGFLQFKRIYYSVAYLFSPKLPFKIKKISKPFTHFKRNNFFSISDFQLVEFPAGLQMIIYFFGN